MKRNSPPLPQDSHNFAAMLLARFKGNPDTSLCAGVSMVELLIVLLITVLFAAGLGTGISVALSIEQRYREEADIRTTMALQMDYLERYFSLTRNAVSNMNSANFPLETAGVNWETNHWTRVRYLYVEDTNDVLSVQVLAGDRRHNHQDDDGSWLPSEKTLRADALLRAPLFRFGGGRVIHVGLEGAGSVRRLVLESEFDETTGLGAQRKTQTRTNRVTRPIRLWNYEE